MHPLDEDPTARRWRLAVHEAGHVVTYRHYGLPIVRAYIEEANGQVDPVSEVPPNLSDKHRAWQVGVIGLSGREAERRANLQLYESGYYLWDARIVEGCIRYLCQVGVGDAAEIERRLQRDAEEIVEAEWSSIEIIARALAARGCLTSAEVDQLVTAS